MMALRNPASSVPRFEPGQRRLPRKFRTCVRTFSRTPSACCTAGRMNATNPKMLSRMYMPRLIRALITGPKNPPVSMLGHNCPLADDGVLQLADEIYSLIFIPVKLFRTLVPGENSHSIPYPEGRAS